MRNIFIFPNNEEVHIKYPENRDIEVGTRFYISYDDGSSRLVEVKRIEQKEKNIYYFLEFV